MKFLEFASTDCCTHNMKVINLSLESFSSGNKMVIWWKINKKRCSAVSWCKKCVLVQSEGVLKPCANSTTFPDEGGGGVLYPQQRESKFVIGLSGTIPIPKPELNPGLGNFFLI